MKQNYNKMIRKFGFLVIYNCRFSRDFILQETLRQVRYIICFVFFPSFLVVVVALYKMVAIIRLLIIITA